MSNPNTGAIFAFATETEARALWSDLVDNDSYKIYAVTIRQGMRIADKPVAWVVLRGDSLMVPSA
jgi:hypothetical protein